jgi:hypothetical protein
MTEGPLYLGGIDDGGDLRDERFLLVADTLLVGGIDDGGDLRDERFLLVADTLLVGGIVDGGDLRDDDGGDLRDDDVEVLIDGCFFFRELCFRGFLEVGLTSIKLPERLRSDPPHEFFLLPVMAVLVVKIYPRLTFVCMM